MCFVFTKHHSVRGWSHACRCIHYSGALFLLSFLSEAANVSSGLKMKTDGEGGCVQALYLVQKTTETGKVRVYDQKQVTSLSDS